MTFEELRNVEIGTILVDQHGYEKYFDGINRKGNRVRTERVDNGSCYSWREDDIKNWTFKKPEPKQLGEVVVHCWTGYEVNGAINVSLENSKEYKNRNKNSLYTRIQLKDENGNTVRLFAEEVE